MTVTGVWSRKPRPAAHCNWAGAPPRTVPAVQVQVQGSLISHPIAIASRLPVRVIASFPCTPMWLLHTNSPSTSTVHHPPAPTARAAGSMRERGQERAEQGKGRSCHGTVASEETETRPRRTDSAPFPSRAAAMAIADAALCLAGGEGGRLVGVAFGRCAGGGRDGD